jgi:AcrR family transcriptional regulator
MSRPYRLGRRQASVDRTAASILDAARRLLAGAPASAVSVAAIARQAGVSRLTVYQRFGSRSGLFDALVPARSQAEAVETDPVAALRRHFMGACEAWATAPALFRHLPAAAQASGPERGLAEQLLAADALRPGCSIREAEDVIGALSSFAVFDRLHRDGRRSAAAVADILMRLTAETLA